MAPIAKYDVDRDARRWFRMMLLVVCKGLREDADVTPGDVARLVGVSDNSIVRFEKGQHFPKMENVDRYLAAYAEAGKLKDPFALLEQIAAYWRANGLAPLTSPVAKAYQQSSEGEITPGEVLKDISEAPSPASGESTSTRKRRTGGG